MISCIDLIKVYYDPVTEYKVAALRGLDLYVAEGELVSIIGPSGAGKTTLINLLSGMDIPTGGLLEIKGVQLDRLSEKERRRFRYEHIGLVNQFTSKNLFSHLTVRENLLMPMKMKYTPREDAQKEVNELLDLFNIKHVENNLTAKISGGESMRLSVAVALARQPEFILADEPTGQLDSKNTFEVIETLKNVNEELGTTMLIVTHDIRYRNVFERSFLIRDGRLVGVSFDLEREKSEFLKDATSANRIYVDPAGFIQIPEKIKNAISLTDVAEIHIHPSMKFATLWNPNIITKKAIEQILKKGFDTWEEEGEMEKEVEQREEISLEMVQELFKRSFNKPTKDKTEITIKDLKRGYKIFGRLHPVIKGIDLTINKGDFVFISGPSGVGKTTLLNLIAGLLTPDEGKIIIKDFPISEKEDTERSDFRLANISYITQYHSLFEPIQLKDNLIIPYLFLKKPYNPQIGLEVAKECMIEHKLDSYPDELSAGEKQRATLALALTRNTDIILADEPTANIDSELAREVMNVLMDVVEQNKTTFIMCSHDLTLLRPGFRHLRLSDGKIIEDTRITKSKLKAILKEYLQIENNK
ncbi:MAG: ABC transporter ATP-binding protein [Candidatus Heimdallarchaeaceae archaeon]